MIQDYIKQEDRDYVVNCKLKLAGIILERGWTVEALEEECRIPASTIYNWLNVKRNAFPGIASLSVICRALGVGVPDVLADPLWMSVDRERYLFVRPFMEEPIDRVRMFSDFYFKCKKAFGSDG